MDNTCVPHMHWLEKVFFVFMTKELLFTALRKKIYDEHMNLISNYERDGVRHV